MSLVVWLYTTTRLGIPVLGWLISGVLISLLGFLSLLTGPEDLGLAITLSMIGEILFLYGVSPPATRVLFGLEAGLAFLAAAFYYATTIRQHLTG